jgi:CRISPR-associated endonuclease/helicase Cas3
MRICYAHTLKGRAQTDWHPLADHLQDTADLAEMFASAFASAEWGRLAGLWHDLGKYSDAFQNYLRQGTGSDDVVHDSEISSRVDHSTAGAQHAVARLGLSGHLLAYVIAGHHAGLPDNEAGESGLSARLRKQIEPTDGVPASLLDQAAPAVSKLQV